MGQYQEEFLAGTLGLWDLAFLQEAQLIFHCRCGAEVLLFYWPSVRCFFIGGVNGLGWRFFYCSFLWEHFAFLMYISFLKMIFPLGKEVRSR